MGLFSRFSNRERIILSFLVVLILLNALTIITSRNLSGFSDDFKSMLQDRLIPASDLAKIQEQLYRNRLNLEELVFMSGYENQRQLIRELEMNNTTIDSIKLRYAGTYLTDDEVLNLRTFDQRIDKYRGIEARILNHLRTGKQEQASALYLRQSGPAFENLLQTTHTLEDIQLSVGQALYRHAERKVNSIQVFAYLSIGITLMITLNMLKVLRYKI